MIVFALTGLSGVGKSHIAKVLSNYCGYAHLRFSDQLKKDYPDDGSWVGDFKTYKHYLCHHAAIFNLQNPDTYIDALITDLVDCWGSYRNVVIDDLRSPRQLDGLMKACDSEGVKLITVRVFNPLGLSVSFMDNFQLPTRYQIQNNNQLSDGEILQEFSKMLMQEDSDV